MKKEHVYYLSQLWNEKNKNKILSEGDSEKIGKIHCGALYARNDLLELIENNFPADTFLALRQTDWTKYTSAKEDTDVIAAFKIIFNLLYQIHQANTFDQGAKRHRRWPFYEILELNRYKYLLKTFLPPVFQTKIFTFFNSYWPNSANLSYVEREDEIDKQELEVYEIFDEYFTQEKTASSEKVEDNELIEAPIILQEDFLALNFKSFLHADNVFDRIKHLRALASDDTQKNSLIIMEVAKYIRETFFHLDYLEARINAPGMLTNAFTRKLHETFSGKEGFLNQKLKPFLTVENNQFFVFERLEKAKARKEKLEKFRKNLSTKEKEIERIHQINGLLKTEENLADLESRLKAKPSESFNLKNAVLAAIGSVDKLINLLKKKLPATMKSQKGEVIEGLLKTLEGNLNELSGYHSPNEILKEYQRLKSTYTRLTYQIPKSCRVFLDKQIQDIHQQIENWCRKSPEIDKIRQEAEQEEEQKRKKEIRQILERIETEVIQLREEIPKPIKIGWLQSLFPGASPMSEEIKADYCDLLLRLEAAIDDYKEDNSVKNLNVIASLIFDLRRLERNNKELNRNSDYKKLWDSINESIETLRGWDPKFKRAIINDTGNNNTKNVLEDSAWCDSLNIENTLPPNSDRFEIKDVLNSLQKATEEIQNSIMHIIENQSKESKNSRYLGYAEDGFLYKALYQPIWQEYKFKDDETTETYTLKLLLNTLYKVRQAARGEGVKGKWWLNIPTLSKQFLQLPFIEISKLIKELPVFFAETGIAALSDQVINNIKMIKSIIPAGDNREKETLDFVQKISNSIAEPTGNPVSALAYSGLIGTDIPQLLARLPNVLELANQGKQLDNLKAQKNESEKGGFLSRLKIYFGMAGNAKAIINTPDLKKYRDQNAILEFGKYVLDIVNNLDNMAAKTGLREHQIILDKTTRKIVRLVLESDKEAKDNFSQKALEIMQGQPFLIQRVKKQQQNLDELEKELKKESDHLESYQPGLKFLLQCLSKPKSADIDQLESHANELKPFLSAYLQQKKKEIETAVDNLKIKHKAELEEKRADKEATEHNEKKLKESQSHQLERYEAELKNSFYIKEYSEILDLLRTVKINKGFNEVGLVGNGMLNQSKHDALLLKMAGELSEYMDRANRSINSKKQHIQQMKHALLEKQSLLTKEFVDQMDNLMNRAYRLSDEFRVLSSKKLSASLNRLSGSTLNKTKVIKLEVDFKKTLELYELMFNTELFQKSIGLHREMASLCRLIDHSEFVSESTRRLAKQNAQRAVEVIRRNTPKAAPAPTAGNPLRFMPAVPAVNNRAPKVAKPAKFGKPNTVITKPTEPDTSAIGLLQEAASFCTLLTGSEIVYGSIRRQLAESNAQKPAKFGKSNTVITKPTEPDTSNVDIFRLGV